MNALSIVSAVVTAVVTDGRTFNILLSNMASVQAGLESLAKRAARKGARPRRVHVRQGVHHDRAHGRLCVLRRGVVRGLRQGLARSPYPAR